MITPAQCRAARTLIQRTSAELAKAAGVSATAITDFELERRMPAPSSLARIQEALEDFGIEFVEQNGPGLGVHLRELQD